jgi:hypothetical protein
MTLGDRSFLSHASRELSGTFNPRSLKFVTQVSHRAVNGGVEAEIASELLLAIARRTRDSRLKGLVMGFLAAAPNGAASSVLELSRGALDRNVLPDEPFTMPENDSDDWYLYIADILASYQLGGPDIRRDAIQRLEETYLRVNKDAELRSDIVFPFCASGVRAHKEAEAFMDSVMRDSEDQGERLMAAVGYVRTLSSEQALDLR